MVKLATLTSLALLLTAGYCLSPEYDDIRSPIGSPDA